jgi:hypothetical protein
VPDSFEQLAMDFDGDGFADIIGSEADAWATTANHLKTRGGWDLAVPVYVEVAVPPAQQAEFNTGGESKRLADRAQRQSQWNAQGWRAVGPGGQPAPLQLAGDPELYPFFPVGLPGPAFLVTRNFDTVLRYNRSVRYVMEVALLAHKLAGGSDFATPWPTDEPGLTRAQVRAVQQWLVQRGHSEVTADGVVGRRTRDAIEKERALRGMPPGRRVGQRTAVELMQAAAPAATAVQPPCGHHVGPCRRCAAAHHGGGADACSQRAAAGLDHPAPGRGGADTGGTAGRRRPALRYAALSCVHAPAGQA